MIIIIIVIIPIICLPRVDVAEGDGNGNKVNSHGECKGGPPGTKA